MLINEAIKEIMYRKRMSQVDLSKKLGVSNSVVSERLREHSTNLSTQNIIEMLEPLRYDLVIQPKGEVRDNQYVIHYEKIEKKYKKRW